MMTNYNYHYEDLVRQITQALDFWRLLFIRGRRMLRLSVAVFRQFEFYVQGVMFLDEFLKILALYQAYLLVPRFLVNLLYFCQHMGSQPPPDMLIRCWEMAYDFGWIMNGVLGALVLVGPWAALAVYLPVVTPMYQLCVHTTRFLIEYQRVKSPELQADVMTLIPVVIRMGVSICIISTAMVMLVGSVNPVIPFLAATLAVLVTVAGKALANALPKSVPASSSSSSYIDQTIFRCRKLVNTQEEGLVLHENTC